MFLRQTGNECLLCSVIMAAGDVDKYAYWLDLFNHGVSIHQSYLRERYPEHTDWNLQQTGSRIGGYLPSDVLRALKLSGKRFVWQALSGVQKTYPSLCRSKKILVVIGIASPPELKGNVQLLRRSEHYRGGSQHAVCIRDGMLYDPGLRRPARLTVSNLRKSLRRIRKVYEFKIDNDN